VVVEEEVVEAVVVVVVVVKETACLYECQDLAAPPARGL